MNTPRNESEVPNLRSLMGEAMWGLGLLGGVLVLVVLVSNVGH